MNQKIETNTSEDRLLISEQNHGKLETITVYRKDIETECRHLLGRLQYLYALLGWPPIETGSYLRRVARERNR